MFPIASDIVGGGTFVQIVLFWLMDDFDLPILLILWFI